MKRLLSGNMAPKILSVVGACLLWLFVMNEQNPLSEMTYTVQLEQRNLAGNLLVFNTPETVRVRVKGPRSVIAGVLAKDIKAYIDLKGVSEGRYAIKVHAQAPLPVEVVEINPDQVMLRTDTYLERAFPVELQFIGDALAGVGRGTRAANHVAAGIINIASAIRSGALKIGGGCRCADKSTQRHHAGSRYAGQIECKACFAGRAGAAAHIAFSMSSV